MKKILITLAVLCLLNPVFSTVGGKISGSVEDLNGVPLANVSIIINELEMGTASKADGSFFLLNIPPGRYTIQFHLIGWDSAVHRNVYVRSNHTTRLSAVLQQTVLESEQTVVVEGCRPLIQQDATSRYMVLSADELIDMPAGDIRDVLVTRAGFTEDADGGIHVRGGRTREIAYLIDGVLVKDPLDGNFLGTVNQNSIRELSVLTGTFDAEFGDAMSAVVSLVTEEGSDETRGRLDAQTADMTASAYHQPFAFSGVNDSTYRHTDLNDLLLEYLDQGSDYPEGTVPLLDLSLKGSLNLTASGRIAESPFFYAASWQYQNEEDPLPQGASVMQDQSLKLTFRPTPGFKFSTQLHSTVQLFQEYSHPWKYLPENQSHTYRTHDRLTLSAFRSFSENLFGNMHFSRAVIGTRTGSGILTPDEYVQPLTDARVYFYVSGNEGRYVKNETISKQLSGSATWQLNRQHQLKSGFTIQQQDLDMYSVSDPWPGGVNLENDTTFAPVELSFYIRDKIELDYMIVNLGLRYDRVDSKADMWELTWYPSAYTPADPLGKWSPRLGIAYPVTDRTVFHFSYGHFFQTPGYSAMYANSRQDIGADLALVGNPRIKPQKTIAFEAGFKQELKGEMVFELTAWMKDVRDLLSTQMFRYLSNTYVVYANTDYAGIKGVDVSVTRRYQDIWDGSLNYTFSVAKGSNSQPLGNYFSVYEQEEIPHKEYYLDFDQRHDISANLNVRFPKSRHMIGKYLSGWRLGLLLNAASGLPYTPYSDPGVRAEINSARKPWTFTTDIRIKKRIPISNTALEITCELLNATDYENVLNVYSRTGKPFDPGFAGVGTSPDANHNPANVGPGRTVKGGLSIVF